MRALRSLSPVWIALLAGCSGPALFAEVEIEELCDTREVTFELSGPPVPLAFVENVDIALPEEVPPDAAEAEFQVVRVRVTTEPGGGSLNFVETATLHLRPSEDAPSVEALRYELPAEPDPHLVETPPGARQDLLPFVRTGKALARLELSGTIPSEPFVAQLQTCLYLRARYAW